MAYFEVIKKGAMLRQAVDLHAKYNSTLLMRERRLSVHDLLADQVPLFALVQIWLATCLSAERSR